jgi:phenylacetate-CoA ligase
MAEISYIRSGKADPEKVAPEQMRRIQGESLMDTLEYVFFYSPFYRKYYKALGISPHDIKSIDDIEKLPLIGREHLETHSEELISAPRSKWIDICPTSGTSGKSIYFPMTRNDHFLFSALCARGAKGLGINNDDTIQIMFTSDNLMQPTKIMTHMFQFNIGALALRVGPAGMEKQIQIMRELKPTVIFGFSTYLHSLARSFASYGFDPEKELNLKMLLTTGGSIYQSRWQPTAIHRETSRLWGAPFYSILGSTELNTGFWECPARHGHHVHWDNFYAEIIDPETGKLLPPGSAGELVLTTFNREAFPLIRYRTGDITSIEEAECPCGRTNPRIMAIIGRRDQAIKIKGTLVFPPQIEEAVLSTPGVLAHSIEIEYDKDGREQIIITIAADVTEFKELSDQIKRAIKSQFMLTSIIKTATQHEIEKSWFDGKSSKPRKFVDRRKDQTP